MLPLGFHTLQENTPANIAVTTSWVDDVSIVNVSIDTASMANMAVFIWVDDTDGALGDELFLSQIRLNEGSTVLSYQPRLIEDERILCLAYYEKWLALSKLNILDFQHVLNPTKFRNDCP